MEKMNASCPLKSIDKCPIHSGPVQKKGQKHGKPTRRLSCNGFY